MVAHKIQYDLYSFGVQLEFPVDWTLLYFTKGSFETGLRQKKEQNLYEKVIFYEFLRYTSHLYF